MGAEKKLAELREVNLQRSPLVSEMKRLPQSEQLFDPVPIPPSDARFPIEQIKHLDFGGLTVHEVRPTRMWKRNRSHFDLLLQEEKEFFSASKNPDNTPKLVHFAWHGAPAKNIRGILECGFLSVPTARVGRIHGHGIYLSTESHARYTRSDRVSTGLSRIQIYIVVRGVAWQCGGFREGSDTSEQPDQAQRGRPSTECINAHLLHLRYERADQS